MNRALLSIALSLAVACEDEPPAPEPTPPPETREAVEPASTDPDPEPPFDFRRAVLEPERQRGTTRTCIVTSVAEATETDPGDPSAVVDAELVRCWYPNGIYEVRAVLVEPADALELTPSPSPTAARRVSLELHGVDQSRRRPIGIARASRLVEMTLPPPREPSREAPVGFDFDLAPGQPAVYGSRRSCAVRAASQVERVSTDEAPNDVVIQMPVTCGHAGGRSRAELHFTEETLEHALVVAVGAVAHGTLEAPRTLRVIHVTPAERP